MKLIGLVTLLFFATALGVPGRAAAQAQQKAPSKGPGVSILQEPYHHLLYENADMRIFDVIVPPHQSTLLHRQNYDFLVISLDKSKITLQRSGLSPVQIKLPEGAVRFYRGGFSQTVTNDAGQPFRNVTIEFLNPLTSGGCSCTGGPADAICACPNASPLPANWERQIGKVIVAGVTLAPGASYSIASQMTTRFLVAVTPFDALNVSVHEPRHVRVRLPAGRFHWLSPGLNTVQNLSSRPLRFVKVEFWGTPVNPPAGTV